jgi:hypothetical protein
MASRLQLYSGSVDSESEGRLKRWNLRHSAQDIFSQSLSHPLARGGSLTPIFSRRRLPPAFSPPACRVELKSSPE